MHEELCNGLDYDGVFGTTVNPLNDALQNSIQTHGNCTLSCKEKGHGNCCRKAKLKTGLSGFNGTEEEGRGNGHLFLRMIWKRMEVPKMGKPMVS